MSTILPSDQIPDSTRKPPLEFTAYFHLPHRRGRATTDFNFGRWVQYHSCDAGFPADSEERYELWGSILAHFANTNGDEIVGGKAREAITKMNKAKTRRAGVTVNKVVLKGVKAGRDINVNVGVAPEGQGRASEVIAVPSATTAEVDAAPPPPYAEGKDGEESGSNSRQVRERDVVPRLVDRHLTRKRPRHDKDSPTSSLAPEGNSSDPPNQHPQPKNLNPPTLTSIPDEPKPKRKRPRTNQIATTTREAIPENIPAISTLHAQEFATGPRLHSSSIRRIREPPPSNPRTRRPTLPTNPNHDTLSTFRESLFTIHTQLTLLRGEVDRLRDAVAGLFQHEALRVLDAEILRDGMVRGGWRIVEGMDAEGSGGSLTDKDPDP